LVATIEWLRLWPNDGFFPQIAQTLDMDAAVYRLVRGRRQTAPVHLRAVKLRGFKSFPDPTELRLEPGVAVVVGPNGSGKSNVADAILWAAGSLSPTELRAEKPDDVLFAGSGGRPPAGFCEVELLFDNAEGDGPLPYSELSVARRLHRGGEGQYLVNGATVRRTDVVELLADLGLGGRMGSVISQGRVEEVLASRPEDRRELVEEAAGLGRFKRRRHRAELKLARVAIQVERARDLESEVKARLRPLALQATAAERAERLGAELDGVRARIAELDLAAVECRLAEAEERRAAAALARRSADERLEALLSERQAAEERLEDSAGRREGALGALYRLRSAGERLELRLETARELAEDARRPPPAASRPSPRLSLARERLAALERTLAGLEGLPPAARALAEGGERLALTELEVPPGDERAAAAALGSRASAVVAPSAEAGLALLERARAAGLGSLTVLLAAPDELLAELSIVEQDDLLAATTGVAATRDGFAYDPERGELRFAGEAAEAVLLELRGRCDAVRREIAELERAPASPPRVDPRPAALAERLAAQLARCASAAARFEAPLRARVDAGAEQAKALGDELRRLAQREVEDRRAAAAAGERSAALEVELARLEGEAGEARRRLEEAAVEPAAGDDREALVERAERLARRLEALGRVNPLAREEHAREKERLDDLVAQRADLEASLEELERLRTELTETVERRFAETFAAVREHFEDVAATLFPGGAGRLELVEEGVEVELRPAGKRVTRLSLLSGGEKALGAISFLFALFLARPCPFYLLDEVEAALDDTNIGRFVELLRGYAGRAQFIVVTHQKRTMEAADTLYGVTMGGDGVSQIVSRRIPAGEPVAATA
jgi:chromosome segregation protein